MTDLLRTRLREDANHLQATGSHAHREIAKRLRELLDVTAKPLRFESLGVDCTAELLRLRKVEEAARAFLNAQAASRGQMGAFGYRTDFDATTFEALFMAVEAPVP